MKIFKFTAWLGIIMIIGTAGSSDIGYIDFAQSVVQIMAGILLCGVSYLMYVATYKPKTKTRRAKIVPIEELRKVG